MFLKKEISQADNHLEPGPRILYLKTIFSSGNSKQYSHQEILNISKMENNDSNISAARSHSRSRPLSPQSSPKQSGNQNQNVDENCKILCICFSMVAPGRAATGHSGTGQIGKCLLMRQSLT